MGDTQLLKGDQTRNNWPMILVVEVESDGHGKIRIVKLRTGSSKPDQIIRRPISKLLLLVELEKM